MFAWQVPVSRNGHMRVTSARRLIYRRIRRSHEVCARLYSLAVLLTALFALLARLSACVMDGVTVGHPRCNEHHCLGRLKSPRDRFCEEHAHLANQCAINGCTLPCSDGMRTCSTEQHRAFEKRQRERGQAIFRLRRRMEGKDGAVPPFVDAQPVLPGDDYFLDEAEVARALQDPAIATALGESTDLPDVQSHIPSVVQDAPDSNLTSPMPGSEPVRTDTQPDAADSSLHTTALNAGTLPMSEDTTTPAPVSSQASGSAAAHNVGSNHSSASVPSPKRNKVTVEEVQDVDAGPSPTEAALSWKGIRAWTHNEQMIVRCCGVIISRATFYTAESPSNCVVRVYLIPISTSQPYPSPLLAIPCRHVPSSLSPSASVILLLRQQLHPPSAHLGQQGDASRWYGTSS